MLSLPPPPWAQEPVWVVGSTGDGLKGSTNLVSAPLTKCRARVLAQGSSVEGGSSLPFTKCPYGWWWPYFVKGDASTQPIDWVALPLTCPQAKSSTWILLFKSVWVSLLPILHFSRVHEHSDYLSLFRIPIWQCCGSQMFP